MPKNGRDFRKYDLPNILHSLYTIERYFDMFGESNFYILADRLDVHSNINKFCCPSLNRLDIIWRIAFECWNFTPVEDYTTFMEVSKWQKL